jgi:hypothetical protein
VDAVRENRSRDERAEGLEALDRSAVSTRLGVDDIGRVFCDVDVEHGPEIAAERGRLAMASDTVTIVEADRTARVGGGEG